MQAEFLSRFNCVADCMRSFIVSYSEGFGDATEIVYFALLFIHFNGRQHSLLKLDRFRLVRQHERQT